MLHYQKPLNHVNSTLKLPFQFFFRFAYFFLLLDAWINSKNRLEWIEFVNSQQFMCIICIDDFAFAICCAIWVLTSKWMLRLTMDSVIGQRHSFFFCKICYIQNWHLRSFQSYHCCTKLWPWIGSTFCFMFYFTSILTLD